MRSKLSGGSTQDNQVNMIPGAKYLVYIISYFVQGVSRGGLTPALALRMPVMTEDVGEAVNATVLPRGTSKSNRVLSARAKENTEFNEPATNSAIRHN